MRQTRSGPELGQRIGTYHAVGLAGALAQFAVRTITLLVVVLIVPDSALLKGSVAAAVVLVLFGLRLVWRLVTARCGGNRCRLHQGGIAVTGPLGGVRDAVVWREATGPAAVVGPRRR
ncbi:hypothetical protein ACIP3B_26005 [Streptomyces anulatus]|uniref:hypothetical protein n=1 Tax=Streptomyces anulatus TaxID=1892 RepID=UPI0033DDB0DB